MDDYDYSQASNIYIKVSVPKVLRRLLQERLSLHKALLVTFPHTHLPKAGPY